MESLKLTSEQKKLVEKLGVAYEKSGLQPAAARIVALLLISDKTEVTFDEIRETLKISKSAASNSINLLLTTGKIEYITLSGDRKRYFRSRLMNWKEETRKNLEGLLVMTTLFKEVLAQRPKSTREFNASLKSVIEFTEFLYSEIDGIFSKWEDQA